MAETITVGDLLVRIRADIGDLTKGLNATQTRIVTLSERTRPGLRRLEGALRMVGISAAGLPGPLGRVAGALSALLPGGLITAGVLAALGALAIAYQTLKRRTEEATKAQEELNKKLAEAPKRIPARVAVLQAEREVGLKYYHEEQQAVIEFMERLEDIEERAAAAAGTWLQTHVRNFEQLLQKVREFHEGLQSVARDTQQWANLRIVPKIEAQADISGIIANDENIQRIVRAFEQQREVFVTVGQSIGLALQEGVYEVFGGGNFFKGLFRTLLGIGVGIATQGIGGAITRALTTSAGGIPGGGGGGGSAMSAAARDSGVQRFFREMSLVAASQGFRG